jgi:hypothetical protein
MIAYSVTEEAFVRCSGTTGATVADRAATLVARSGAAGC